MRPLAEPGALNKEYRHLRWAACKTAAFSWRRLMRKEVPRKIVAYPYRRTPLRHQMIANIDYMICAQALAYRDGKLFPREYINHD